MSTNGNEQGAPFTPKEVASLERCGPETIRRALRAGELRGYKVGRDWRIRPDALEEYRRREYRIEAGL